jgi:hypothetical protein
MKKKFLFCLFILISAMAFAQDSLQQYTGKYIFPEGAPVPDVEVVFSNGALSMLSAAGSSSLVQLGADSFQIVEFSGTAVFKRAEDKKIKAVHIEAMGYVLEGQRQSDGLWNYIGYFRSVQREKFFRKNN